MLIPVLPNPQVPHDSLNLRLTRRGWVVALGLAAACGTSEKKPPPDTVRRELVRSISELQTLLAAPRRSPVPVRLAPGTYDLLDTLSLSHVDLDGGGSTLRLGDTFQAAVGLIASGRTKLSSISVERSASVPLQVDGIHITAAPSGEIGMTDVTVRGMSADGISVTGAATATNPVTLSSCTASGCDRGLLMTRASHVVVESGRFNSNGRVGAQMVRSRDVRIEQTQVNNNGAGVVAGDGLVVLYSQSFQIDHLSAIGNRRRGLSLGGGDASEPVNNDWGVRSSLFNRNGDHGATVDPTLLGQEGVPQKVSGRFDDCQANGNGNNGINVTSAQGLVIDGCQGNDNGANGLGIASADIEVLDCTFSGNQRYGIALFGGGLGRSLYGNHLLKGNTLSDNSLGDVHRSRSSPNPPGRGWRPAANAPG